MKTIIRNGMELHEIRPGVYECNENGIEYRYINTGEIIKARRQDLKMSQQELADRIGVNIGTISRYESGKIETVSIERKKMIADALDCTEDYLDALVEDPHESLGSEWSQQEIDLVELFRDLSSDQRAAILTMMKGMVK